MKMYNALVEVDRKLDAHKVGPDDLDDVVEALAQHHVAVSISARGWAEARISLPAESIAQATTTACALVAAAYGAEPIACEVMTEAEFLAREGWEPMPDLITVSQAAELLGVSRQAVQDRIHRGTLQATRVGDGKTSSYVLPRSAVVSSGS